MDLFLEDIKSHFKLDFIDKIIISIVFVIGTILCPFYCFAVEPEELEFTRVTNFEVISTTDGGAIRENTSQYAIAYIELEPGYSYTFTATGTFRRTGFADNISDGEILQNFAFVNTGNSITFTSTTLGNKFFVSSTGSTVPGTITRVPLRGMEETIDILSYDISIDSIWNTFLFTIPYIVVVVLCLIGLLFIKRLASYLSKGKSRI